MKAAILCSAAALFSGRDLVAGVGMLCERKRRMVVVVCMYERALSILSMMGVVA
jgi:hypothetical protein